MEAKSLNQKKVKTFNNPLSGKTLSTTWNALQYPEVYIFFKLKALSNQKWYLSLYTKKASQLSIDIENKNWSSLPTIKKD